MNWKSLAQLVRENLSFPVQRETNKNTLTHTYIEIETHKHTEREKEREREREYIFNQLTCLS